MHFVKPIEALKHQLDTLSNSARRGFVHLSIPYHVGNVMGWLNAQSVYPRLYWQSRDEGAVEYAALGVVKAFDSLAALQADFTALADYGGEQPDYFGGMAFDPDAPGWQHFPGCYFLLPRIVLRRHQGGATLSLNLRFDDRCPEAEIAQARACLAALEEEQSLPCLLPHVYQRDDRPTLKEWMASVALVTHPDQLGHTPKVVLSRETCLTLAFN